MAVVAAAVAGEVADSDPYQIADETRTPFKQLPHLGAACFRTASLCQRDFLVLAVHPGKSNSESDYNEATIEKHAKHRPTGSFC